MILKSFLEIFISPKNQSAKFEQISDEFNKFLGKFFSNTVTKNINPHEFKNGILYVLCPSQDMANELYNRKEFLIKEINANIKEKAVKDLKFSVK